MAILKSILLLSSAMLYGWAITPPQPPVVSKTVYKGQTYEYIVRQMSYLAGTIIMLPSFLHAILLAFPQEGPLTITTYLCPSISSATAAFTQLSPSFLIGTVLLLAGAFARIWSYHVLGTLFTFEVVIKDDHKLITKGPYGHVRHPAYTGVLLLTSGAYLMHFGNGGYVAECGIERVPGMMLLTWAWRITSLVSFVSLYKRCAIEDGKLYQEFGASWLKYRQEVPYALVPYLF